MTIWALKSSTDPKQRDFVATSLKKEGVARFGWSYLDGCNLNLSNEEASKTAGEDYAHEVHQCRSKSYFFADIKPGDWVVYINITGHGKCIAAQVSEGYSFEETNAIGDFRHKVKIDLNSIIEFDRNDAAVLPNINRRLKLQGHYWRIYYVEDFKKTLDNLSSGKVELEEEETAGIYHLVKELEGQFVNISKLIHKTHPEKKLEELVAKIFESLPRVKDAVVNGSGWGTDYGADVIVTYESGLGLFDLVNEEKLVIQVKSYEGEHNDLSPVDQIQTAIEKYDAHAGLIITTATPGKQLIQAIDKLNDKQELENKPVKLFAGKDVAKFFLKHGADHLIKL